MNSHPANAPTTPIAAIDVLYAHNLSSAERELERVRASIGKIIDAIKAGFAGPELKAEMDELQVRKESLLARLATADAPVPLLHSKPGRLVPREGFHSGVGPPERRQPF